jgi:hypothetical protein
MNDSFLSVVAHTKEPNNLLVRARREGDIEKVFPKAEVIANAGSDYLFRATVSRLEVANVIANRIEHIEYSNFKGSVKNKPLHDAYMKFWGIMIQLQDRFNLTFN